MMFSSSNPINPVVNQTKRGFFQRLLSGIKYVLFDEAETPYSAMYSNQPTNGNGVSAGALPNSNYTNLNPVRNSTIYQNTTSRPFNQTNYGDNPTGYSGYPSSTNCTIVVAA